MRVAMYYNNKDVRLQEMEIPSIGPEELLVKIMASGVCGSDVLEWYRVPRAPLVLGHEIAGEIASVGHDVQGWKEGDRVVVSHHVPCNMCRYCLAGHEAVCDTLKSTNFDPGGFCEYVRVPAINVRSGLYRMPDSMSYEEGVFAEPLACVYRGWNHIGWSPGRSVLVIGAGIAGLLHVKLACATGSARVIAVDINETRLQIARGLGAETLTAGDDLVQRVKEANNGRLADLVVVSTGAAPAIRQAFHLVDRGGTILFFAPSDPGVEVEMPFNDLWRQEITMTSTYAGAPRDIRAAMELIASGRVEVKGMITHRLPLERTGEAFELVSQAADSLKVVIEPHG